MFDALIVPGCVAFVFLLVVTYLQRQTREPQFHIWQAVWLTYLLHFIAIAFSRKFPAEYSFFAVVSRLALVGMALLLVLSARKLMRRDDQTPIDLLEIAFDLTPRAASAPARDHNAPAHHGPHRLPRARSGSA